MRKLATWTLGIVIVLLIGTSGVLYQKYRQSSSDYAAMKTAEEAARAHFADAFNAIAEIQDSLSAITVADDQVRLLPQTDRKLSAPDRREALQAIAQINASIQRTKEKIKTLESNLSKSGTKIAGLQRMINVLKHTMADKQVEVAELTERVDALQTTVAGLETSVQQAQDTILAKQQVIADTQRELGTIFYVIGTKKELTDSGIIIAKGGVLGMGKTLKLSGRYDESRFTTLDTDAETTVRAPSAKVQVLSPQPTSSYELRVEGNQVELHILDPREFRKIKHLVIMTA